MYLATRGFRCVTNARKLRPLALNNPTIVEGIAIPVAIDRQRVPVEGRKARHAEHVGAPADAMDQCAAIRTGAVQRL